MFLIRRYALPSKFTNLNSTLYELPNKEKLLHTQINHGNSPRKIADQLEQINKVCINKFKYYLRELK